MYLACAGLLHRGAVAVRVANMTDTKKKVLYIGGHGKVGLLAAPKLVKAGHTLDSLVRKEEQFDDIKELGANPVLADVTELTVSQWEELLRGYDVVVWGAGNGGRAGADATWAVDRDAALKNIDALENLHKEGNAPAYVMISYLGATTNTTDPDEASWYAYVESKKAVDKRLLDTDLDFVILGPSTLTEEPSQGIKVVPDDSKDITTKTSRELVAEVVTEVVGRDKFPASPLAFVDGEDAVDSI